MESSRENEKWCLLPRISQPNKTHIYSTDTTIEGQMQNGEDTVEQTVPVIFKVKNIHKIVQNHCSFHIMATDESYVSFINLTTISEYPLHVSFILGPGDAIMKKANQFPNLYSSGGN